MSEPLWNEHWTLVIRRVRRIGVLRLWHDPFDGSYHVSLDNRTYHHVHRIAPDKLASWFGEFDAQPPPNGEAA